MEVLKEVGWLWWWLAIYPTGLVLIPVVIKQLRNNKKLTQSHKLMLYTFVLIMLPLVIWGTIELLTFLMHLNTSGGGDSRDCDPLYGC